MLDTLIEIGTKLWVLVFIPVIGWLEKKRREFTSLSQKVENLEVEIKHINAQISQDRDERETRRKEDIEYRNTTSDKMDKIYNILMDVRKDTAVNATKLEERK